MDSSVSQASNLTEIVGLPMVFLPMVNAQGFQSASWELRLIQDATPR